MGVSVLSLKLVVGGISSSTILTCLILEALGELTSAQIILAQTHLASPNRVLGLRRADIPGGLNPPGLPGPAPLELLIPNPFPGVALLPPKSLPAVEAEKDGRNFTPSAIFASSSSSASLNRLFWLLDRPRLF